MCEVLAAVAVVAVVVIVSLAVAAVVAAKEVAALTAAEPGEYLVWVMTDSLAVELVTDPSVPEAFAVEASSWQVAVHLVGSDSLA